MIVDTYEIDGNKLSMTLKGKEKLFGTYYIDTYQELLYLKENIKYGVSLKLNGDLREPNTNTIPNNFNYKKYLNDRNIFYVLDISEIEIIKNDVRFIYNIKNIINERIIKIDNTGYMKAFILGDKSLIDSETYANYQKIGITHLFALSGMHVGLLSGILSKLLSRINDKYKYLIIDAFLIIYGFIVGFPSSIKRCILFFVINTLNKYFKLEIELFKILLIVIVILMFYQYQIIFDIGFIYSVCTVGGIILCNKFISHDKKIVTNFRLSLVAFLFSLPISLYSFYEINLLSIFYNMFFIPLISLLIYPLGLLSFFISFFYKIFVLLINFLEVSSYYLSKFELFNIYLNFNIWQILLFYFFLYLIFFKYKKIYIFLLLGIVILDLFFPYLDKSCYVHFFDVGQGDSSLIVLPYKKNVIFIDTGGTKHFIKEEWMKKDDFKVTDNIISFMKSKGVKKISYFVISHGDYDHMGEAISLVNNFKVEKVIFNCGKFNELEQELIKVLDKKKIPYYSCIKELNIDDSKLYFLNNKEYGNENDNSSVIYTELDGYKFMFMGDAGVEVEEDLIKKYNLHNIDVLKVGHHGSKTSSSKSFIDEISPKHSIISVGKNNRYGHPNDSVLDNLENSKIYRTDRDGSIMFKTKNNKLKIETCAP